MRRGTRDRLEKSQRLDWANEELYQKLSHLCGSAVGLMPAVDGNATLFREQSLYERPKCVNRDGENGSRVLLPGNLNECLEIS